MSIHQQLPQGVRDYFKGKSVLITGGAGFIGSSLAQALVPMGARVTVLDALLPQYGGNKFNFVGIEEEIEFILYLTGTFMRFLITLN